MGQQVTTGTDALGIIPEGIWIMDEAKSHKLVPAALTLWVVRDDGDRLVWVSVETERDGKISVNSFDGRYGGKPVTVLGNGFVVSLTSPRPRTVCVSGEVPGMGPFEETSEISEDGQRMTVNGVVRKGDSTQTWSEIFHWHSASPHAIRAP